MDVVNCKRLFATAALLLACHRADALPVLHEVYYDAPGGDAQSVFTEIVGSVGFSLDGFSLVGINGADGDPYRTIPLDGAIIPADGVLVLATGAATGEALTARDFIANIDWQNGADAVLLIGPGGALVDALQYGTLGAFAAGEGTPAPDAPAGRSLSRNSAAADTDNNAVDFVIGLPTPGRGYALPVVAAPVLPEPASLLLAGAGMVLGVFVRGRRGRPQHLRRTPC